VDWTGLGCKKVCLCVSVCSVSDIDKLRKACFIVLILLRRGMLLDDRRYSPLAVGRAMLKDSLS
jgi:hypothetical protein